VTCLRGAIHSHRFRRSRQHERSTTSETHEGPSSRIGDRRAKALDRSHQAFKAAQRLASLQTISDKGKAALRKVGLHILIARGYEAILNIATNQ
jgi:hypothetical protein